MSNFLLPMSEFNRIHQVIHGTIKDEGNPGKGCTLFACIGALILSKHYKIPARAVAGGFAMCVEPEKNMFFGRDGGGVVEFDEDGFHMWVQTENYIIDFMSPLYHEAFQDVQRDAEPADRARRHPPACKASLAASPCGSPCRSVPYSPGLLTRGPHFGGLPH